ncbi:hypothetical protein WJX81_006653 [Elliptochloris bilobata]|uniref:Protein kinase domain-containing protein n=1 Tax=Elliptochloris bilobata TaxID=381761 RepID=A0AAW1RRC6_9CHLO
MAAEVREAKRDPLPSDLRENYLIAKATYEAMWQSQLDNWEVDPPPVPKFAEMVGTENFISENRLTHVKAAGEGSFATVDICRLRSSNSGKDQLVAVKRLRPNSQIDLSVLANEGKILRTLRHRNIASYIGIGASLRPTHSARVGSGNHKESYYIVQEYLDGGTLKHKVLEQMTNLGRLAYSNADACAWAEEVADGLAYLHSYNPQVIHRDVKLDNVLLRRRGKGRPEAAICDFGLAVSVLNPSLGSKDRRSRLPRDISRCPSRVHTQMARKERGEPVTDRSVAEKGRELDRALSTATTRGSRVSARTSCSTSSGMSAGLVHTVFDLTGRTGSYLYMSPEVARCEPYNDRADVFSFGVVLYELLSREITAAFILANARRQDPELCELYAHKVSEGYRRPIPDDWPEDIKRLVEDCWAAEANDRPPMRQVAMRLADFLASAELEEWDRRALTQAKAFGCQCAVM